MSAASTRHRFVTGALYAARRLSHPGVRTPIHSIHLSLAKTSTQGDTE
jgi:hypothetical protein